MKETYNLLLISQVEKQAQLSSTTSHSSSTFITGTTTSSATAVSNISEPSQSSLLSPINKTKPSTTSQSVENLASVANSSVLNQTTSPNVPANKYQQQSSNVTPLIPGFPFGYNAMMSKYCLKHPHENEFSRLIEDFRIITTKNSLNLQTKMKMQTQP